MKQDFQSFLFDDDSTVGLHENEIKRVDSVSQSNSVTPSLRSSLKPGTPSMDKLRKRFSISGNSDVFSSFIEAKAMDGSTINYSEGNLPNGYLETDESGSNHKRCVNDFLNYL